MWEGKREGREETRAEAKVGGTWKKREDETDEGDGRDMRLKLVNQQTSL